MYVKAISTTPFFFFGFKCSKASVMYVECQVPRIWLSNVFPPAFTYLNKYDDAYGITNNSIYESVIESISYGDTYDLSLNTIPVNSVVLANFHIRLDAM
jgi:hypothetical protein